MSSKNITNLGFITVPLVGTEVMPAWNGTTTKKVTVANLTAERAVGGYSFTAGAGGFISGGPITASTSNLTLTIDNITNYGQPLVINSAGSLPMLLQANGVSVVGLNNSNVTFTGVNLVQGTPAKGINFTANPHAAGMTSQLLNWYEEGAWTPNQGSGLAVVGAFSSSGRYIRIGRQVTLQARFISTTSISCSAFGVLCTNQPYSSDAVAFTGSLFGGSPTKGGTTATAGGILYSVDPVTAGGNITVTITYFV